MKNISYSTAGFNDRNVEDALDAIAEAGFSQTEIQGQAPHLDEPLTGPALAAFRARLKNRGLSARTIHAPQKRYALGVPDEDWRRENIVELESYIEFAVSL